MNEGLKRTLQTLAQRLIASPMAQRAVNDAASRCREFMGIGTATEPGTSGEAVVAHVLKARRPPGRPACIFDVGANQGGYSRMLREMLGDSCVIHAFEPGHDSYEHLVANTAGWPNLTLNRVALGRQQGTSVLHYDKSGSGLASMTRRRLDHFGLVMDKSEPIEVDTVDNYCERHGIEAIDLLKLDVEGHELDVLAGAQESLRQRRIALVSFEFGGCNIDTRTYLQDFWYLFKEHGFGALYRILPGGYLRELPEYRENDEQFITTMYLAALTPV